MKRGCILRECALVSCIVFVAIGFVGCPPNNNPDDVATVPNTVGMTQAAAETAIKGAGLSVGSVTREYSDSVPQGEVMRQNPGAGMRVQEGSRVDLWVSRGSAPAVEVPDVVDLPQAEAETAIEGAGLVVGTVTYQSDDVIVAGNVISQIPEGGATASEGSGVDLWVSTGRKVMVPDVVGMPKEDAEAAITSTGLSIVQPITLEYHNTVPEGYVIIQTPDAGTEVSEGTAVTLVVSRGPLWRTVPNVVGMIEEDAETAVTDAGLNSSVDYEYHDTVPEGSVIRQNPAAGTRLAVGGNVNLVVSKGPRPKVPVPDVVGMSEAGAETEIAAVGLTVGTISRQFHDTVPEGDVISQTPSAGTLIEEGSSVDLVISRGPGVLVPDVTGMAETDARTTITNAGLNLGSIERRYDDTVPKDHVISQSPVGNTRVEEGSSVQLVVSKGPPRPVTVPDVVGMTEAAAKSAIESVELVVGTVTYEYSATVEPGEVIKQEPGGGTAAYTGDSVDLWVSRLAPDLVVEPTSLSLNPDSPSKTVTVSNGGGGNLRWSATSNDSRVTINPNSFSGNSKTVTISASDFSESYTVNVVFKNNDDASDTETVVVTVAPAASADLEVIPNSVSLDPDNPSKTVTVRNAGVGTLNWSASSSDSRVTVNPGSGTTQESVQVTISTSDTSANYSVEVTFTNDDNAADAEIVEVSVTTTAQESNLDVSPNSVFLDPDTPSETVTVSNIGGGTLSWSASWSDSRLEVSPSSGSTEGSLEVTITASGFTEDYTGEITFRNDDDAADSETVTVTVSSGSGALELSATSVELSPSASSATVTVSNAGGGTLEWSSAWSWDDDSSDEAPEPVVVDPSSGTTTGSSEVTIRAVDFSMDYTGTVTFENKDNPSDTATVQITVTGSPDLAVSHSSVRVSCSEPTMTIEVLNTGGGTLSWTASLAGGGLVVTPTSDTTREATAVSISTNSIDCQGPYTTYLTFTNSNDATDTEVVAVSVGPDAFTIELIPDVTLRMVWIPRGTFLMGRYSGEQDSLTNEDPQHEVTLSQGFWMGRYELTKAQWTAVMGTEPWSGRSYVLDDPDTPATHVDWGDIQDYIEDLNTLTQLAFRLPTEAEWEYACRAETTSRFYWGNDSDHTRIGNYAWWYDNAEGIEERYAHIVGKKYDNDFGLYDMSGNVWEFCQDWYAAYPNDGKPVTDPTGPSSGTTRVIRGGGWGSEAKDCRSARRMRASELSTNINMAYRSFRLAR